MILFQKPSVSIGNKQGNPRTTQGCPIHRVLCDEWAPIRELDRKPRLARVKIPAAICALFLFVISLVIPGWARSHKQSSHPSPADAGYVFALATANRFMHAWQAGDLANGMVLISDGIRHSENADKFEQFFSTSNERAFEIGAGHGNHGRYSFPIVLVVSKGTRSTRRSSEITVVDAGKNDWVVDKLP